MAGAEIRYLIVVPLAVFLTVFFLGTRGGCRREGRRGRRAGERLAGQGEGVEADALGRHRSARPLRLRPLRPCRRRCLCPRPRLRRTRRHRGGPAATGGDGRRWGRRRWRRRRRGRRCHDGGRGRSAARGGRGVVVVVAAVGRLPAVGPGRGRGGGGRRVGPVAVDVDLARGERVTHATGVARPVELEGDVPVGVGAGDRPRGGDLTPDLHGRRGAGGELGRVLGDRGRAPAHLRDLRAAERRRHERDEVGLHAGGAARVELRHARDRVVEADGAGRARAGRAELNGRGRRERHLAVHRVGSADGEGVRRTCARAGWRVADRDHAEVGAGPDRAVGVGELGAARRHERELGEREERRVVGRRRRVGHDELPLVGVADAHGARVETGRDVGFR